MPNAPAVQTGDMCPICYSHGTESCFNYLGESVPKHHSRPHLFQSKN